MNLLDLAFQAFVYSGAGLNIRRCCLMHVNRDYVRRGAVDPKKFFKLVDVTKDVSGLSREIEPQLEDMFSMIRRKQEPDIKIGPHCSDPYACPLTGQVLGFSAAGQRVQPLLRRQEVLASTSRGGRQPERHSRQR